MKRLYGQKIDIYNESSESVSYETGNKTVEKSKWTIKHAPVLPVSLARKVAYQLSFVNSHKNFTYGGVFETGTRSILIHRKDLPNGFVLGIENWYIVIKHIRYEIVSIDEYLDEAYFINVKELKGAQRNETFEVEVKQEINIEDTVDEQ